MPTEASRNNGLFSSNKTHPSPSRKDFPSFGLDDIQLHLSRTIWVLQLSTFQGETAIWHHVSIPVSDAFYFQQPGIRPRTASRSCQKSTKHYFSCWQLQPVLLAGSFEPAPCIREPFLPSPQSKPISRAHSLTFNLNSGCPRWRQSLYVVSFAGEHCALINTWRLAKKRKGNTNSYIIQLQPSAEFQLRDIQLMLHRQLEGWAGCQSKARGFQCN